MPPNTKKCCEKCWRGVWKDCGKASCPCHTPSLDKSEHDGTCRTPECYEKRPTPAVEDWEKEFDERWKKKDYFDFDDKAIKSFFRTRLEANLKSDRQRIVRCIWKLLEEKAYTEAVPDNVKDYGEPNKVIAVRHLVNFITNLK